MLQREQARQRAHKRRYGLRMPAGERLFFANPNWDRNDFPAPRHPAPGTEKTTACVSDGTKGRGDKLATAGAHECFLNGDTPASAAGETELHKQNRCWVRADFPIPDPTTANPEGLLLFYLLFFPWGPEFSWTRAHARWRWAART